MLKFESWKVPNHIQNASQHQFIASWEKSESWNPAIARKVPSVHTGNDPRIICIMDLIPTPTPKITAQYVWSMQLEQLSQNQNDFWKWLCWNHPNFCPFLWLLWSLNRHDRYWMSTWNQLSFLCLSLFSCSLYLTVYLMLGWGHLCQKCVCCFVLWYLKSILFSSFVCCDWFEKEVCTNNGSQYFYTSSKSHESEQQLALCSDSQETCYQPHTNFSKED